MPQSGKSIPISKIVKKLMDGRPSNVGAVDGVQNYFFFLVQLLDIFAGLHSIVYLAKLYHRIVHGMHALSCFEVLPDLNGEVILLFC